MDELGGAFADIRQGQVLRDSLPVINEAMEKAAERVTRKVMNVLDRGDVIDPQFAVQSWIELHSIQMLQRSLTKRVQIGEDAGWAVSSQMSEGGTDAEA